jgi:hypothetical protein
MIGIRIRTEFNSRKITRKAKDANFRSLGHAAASIRLTAKRSIRRSKTESSPGTPPHTRKGQLKKSIVYAVEKQKETAVIGPDIAIVGQSAMAHEFGGRYRGDRYDRRPFMGPALRKMKDRLPRKWAGSIR